MIVYFISEIGIVRAGILEADKNVASFVKFLCYPTVFLLVFFNQICQSFVVFRISVVISDYLLIAFGFITRSVADIPEGGDGFAMLILIENYVLFAQKTPPMGLLYADSGYVFFNNSFV